MGEGILAICKRSIDGNTKEFGRRTMRATVMVDNRNDDKLQGEWGLSIYIEYRGKKLLLDAGASGLFVTNAQKLGIALEKELMLF